MRILTALLQCSVLGLVPWAAPAAAQGGPGGETLDVHLIDVEGGEATLFVAPGGESLLVDTGWPGLEGRDADRIAAVARQAGVTQIDYLLVTHFHTDHMGGALQLAERLPVRHFIDHGETVDREERPRAAFARYVALRSQAEHRTVAPGDTLPIPGLDVVILASGGAVLQTPLAGAGRPNPYCDGFAFQGEEITRGVHRQPGGGRSGAGRAAHPHGARALDPRGGAARRLVHGDEQPQRLPPHLRRAMTGAPTLRYSGSGSQARRSPR